MIYCRQRKGLSTLCLLILAESISLTNAVTFWNQYNTWSARGQQQNHGSSFESPFSRAARQAQECAADKQFCQPESNNKRPTKLFPRTRVRLSSAIKTGDYCRDCTSRCQESNRNNILNVRGGDTASTIATPMMETAAKAASEAFADTAAVNAANAVTPYGIPLNGWKVIFQVFLTFINVACWLIPLKSKKMTENKLALSLANAFSGGVFLSLAFGHLLPECTHGFHGMNEATPYMLALGGYLLIFFVEKIAFDTEQILHEVHAAGNNKKNGKEQEQTALGSGRGAVILLGALAVHSILEMTALGLADSFGDSALLSLSIALHQVRELLCVYIYARWSSSWSIVCYYLMKLCLCCMCIILYVYHCSF